MALYLGKEKVAPSNLKLKYVNHAIGTVMSDDTGTLTFPPLDFEPKLITVWNVTQKDLKQEAENNGEEWDDSYTRYIYNGTMLMAVYQYDTWIAQGLTGSSGETCIANASVINTPSVEHIGNNIYTFRLTRYAAGGAIMPEEDSVYDITNTEFNYAIYG